jgi:hypothetical protein
MTEPADIVVHAPNGAAVAAVEVKNVRQLDLEYATEIRELLLRDDALPPGAYFVVVSQERGFLWPPNDETTREFSMERVMSSYATSLMRDGVWLRVSELEGILRQWLLELAMGLPRAQQVVADSGLAQSGFADAIRDGSLWTRAA